MSGEKKPGGDAPASSPRERYREQVRAEIKAHGWAQVAAAGASALSLNAIAKEMGLSGPALYRYYRSRDDLITELVLDAYRELAERVTAAAVPGDPPAAQLTAGAAALRVWALAAPHRYLLIYGTPVPGYHAPPEATELARRIMAILLDAFTELSPPGQARRRGPAAAAPAAAAALEAHLADHAQWAGGHRAPPAALRRALAFWTRLHGVVSLEVAGHFAGMGFDPALLYAAELAAVTSLRAAPSPGRQPAHLG